MRLSFLPLTAFLAIVGCGTTVSRNEQVDPQKFIAAAEEAGSKGVPQADLHITMAKDGYARAQALISDGDDDEAQLMLQRSSADAQLALELTRAHSTQADAESAREKVDKLQK